MSLSLITKRLHGLGLTQKAAACLLPRRNLSISGVTDDICFSSTSTHSHRNMQYQTCQMSPFLLLRRKFSSENIISATDNDDGGSVSQLSTESELSSMTNDELAEMSTIPGWNLVHNPPRRNTPRGALVGKVVSDKMQKTVNVAVDRYRIVPKYRKRLKYTKKFMAHDEHEVCNMGDLVMIVPCQKISRHKHFMVREILRPKGQL